MNTKVAIVTGASSGIGAAAARRLHDRGYIVYAAARRIERMAPLAEAGIRAMRVDVTDDASLAAFVSQIISETGRVDVLVNNAGYGSLGALEDVPMIEARHQFDVNLFGLARLVQLVVPHMREQREGRIINISSMGGRIHLPLCGWYHATKFAVEGFSDTLRMELAPFGIRVVVIEPGAIDTEWHGVAGDNLIATSGQGAYAGQAAALVTVLSAGGLASPPEVIAKAIVRAAEARRPRTRYAVGIGAKPVLLARRVLPDKMFDRMVRLVFGVGSRIAGSPPVMKILAGRAS
ncbi:MAG: oxidoreductase [Mycobacterium sp.]|uniref:oxidoreductase n=1 Tax=Mycobacterium sp. TaxID=1785 RepID=UPI003F950281